MKQLSESDQETIRAAVIGYHCDIMDNAPAIAHQLDVLVNDLLRHDIVLIPKMNGAEIVEYQITVQFPPTTKLN